MPNFVRSRIRSVSVTLAVLASIGPASAFDTNTLDEIGSLPFDEVARFIRKQSTALASEVDQRLIKINKTADGISCYGMRFSSEWKNLKGYRVSPYVCEFDGEWLTINADVKVYGPNKKRFEKISRTAFRRRLSLKRRACPGNGLTPILRANKAGDITKEGPAFCWGLHPVSLS